MHKLESLTSLRFIAAAMIVVLHMNDIFGVNVKNISEALRNGVSFFYVLSGFILTYVYSSRPKLDVGRFLLARFARLWPAHMTALILMWILLPENFKIHFTLPRLLANVFMVHAWIPAREYYFSFVGPSWSISTEIGFYFCFLLLFRNWARTWHWKLALTFCISCGMVPLSNLLDLWFPPSTVSDRFLGLTYCHPLARLFEFTLGMSTALLWNWASPRIRLRPAVATVIEVAAWVFACFWGAYLPSMAAAMAQFSWIGGTGAFWIAVVGGCLGFAPLIFIMALSRGVVSRMLTFRPLVILGEISFTVYLIHEPLLFYISRFLKDFAVLPNGLAIGLFSMLLIAISYLIWVLIEIPCRGFIVRLWPARTEEPASKTLVSYIRPRERFFARAGVIAAALTVTLLSSGAYYLVNVRSALQLISPAEAARFRESSLPELRDVKFGEHFLLLGAQTKSTGAGLQVELVWQSIGQQRLEYAIPVHVMDGQGNLLMQGDRVQDARERIMPPNTVWRDTFNFPAAKVEGAEAMAIGLLQPKKNQWLPPDQGQRDWGGVRLLIPVLLDNGKKKLPVASAINHNNSIDLLTEKEVQLIPAAEATQFRESSPAELRDVNFGERFLLLGAQTKSTDAGLQVELVWQSLGEQPLEYVIPVHVMDGQGNLLMQGDRAQDARERIMPPHAVWRDTFDFPAAKVVGAQTVGIGLRQEQEKRWLSPDRGPRDWGGVRLVFPVRPDLGKKELPVSSDQTYDGYVDTVNEREIVGWAWNSILPDETLEVEIYKGKKLLGRVRADILRPDLAGRMGHGRHGFRFNMTREEKVSQLRVKVANSNFELKQSHKKP